MKPLLPLLCVSLGAIAADPNPPVGVPADAKHFNGKWYRIYSEKSPTWHQARDKCKSLGGQLATIPDAATWKFVKGLRQGKPYLWLGASDEKAEGVWKWQDGSVMTFNAWIGAGPDNSGHREHYLAIWGDLWNDATKACPIISGFVCEWKR